MKNEEMAIKGLKEFLEYHQEPIESLKTLSSKKGFIYVIMDKKGRIHATRKSYASAYRILGKGTFSFLKQVQGNNPNHLLEDYQVVTLHLSDFGLIN